jgi:hypothetical protein
MGNTSPLHFLIALLLGFCALSACHRGTKFTVDKALPGKYETAAKEISPTWRTMWEMLDTSWKMLDEAEDMLLAPGLDDESLPEAGIIEVYGPNILGVYPLSTEARQGMMPQQSEADASLIEDVGSLADSIDILLCTAFLNTTGTLVIEAALPVILPLEMIRCYVSPSRQVTSALFLQGGDTHWFALSLDAPLSRKLQVPVRRQRLMLSQAAPRPGDILYGYCELETVPYFQAVVGQDSMAQREWRARFYFKVGVGPGWGR